MSIDLDIIAEAVALYTRAVDAGEKAEARIAILSQSGGYSAQALKAEALDILCDEGPSETYSLIRKAINIIEIG